MPRSSKLTQGKNGKLASAKSKTGDAKCSAAASLFARGQATADTYKILGECRSKARMVNQAKLQREAGNEGKAQVLEKRAERGLTVAARVAKAKELIASRKASKATPAKAAKAAGAGVALAQRLREADYVAAAKASGHNVIEKDAYFHQTTVYDKKWTKVLRFQDRPGEDFDTRFANNKMSVAARNELAAARDAVANAKTKKAKREAADNVEVAAGRVAMLSVRNPSNPAYKEALKAPGRNTAFRAARAKELLAQRAAKAAPAKPAGPSLLEQARATRTAKGDRTTRLKALAERSMSLAESRATKAGSLSGAAQDRMIDRSMAAASRYNALEAARTPYKPSAGASVPAIKSGLPTTKGGVPAETPKLSLLEQARIRRAAKNADGNRDGRLAARAKKQYDAARRNMKANLEKAKTLGPGQGDKYVAKATKYGKRLDVASERYVNLYNSWATGGKFTTARVIK